MLYSALVSFCLLTTFCNAYPREHYKDNRKRYDDAGNLEALRSLRSVHKQPAAASYKTNRAFFDCKQANEPCYGAVPCCSDKVCFWENGYSLGRAGKCVTCVAQGQLCQRDTQCCEPNVCQKERGWDVNGVCSAKLGNGAECHDDDQCQSGYCNIQYYENFVMRKGGKCEALVVG